MALTTLIPLAAAPQHLQRPPVTAASAGYANGSRRSSTPLKSQLDLEAHGGTHPLEAETGDQRPLARAVFVYDALHLWCQQLSTPTTTCPTTMPRLCAPHRLGALLCAALFSPRPRG